MLERQSFQENRPDEDHGQSLSPSYFYEILKRRALYFAIPFLLISAIGSLITAAWPSRYLSQGTILVSSQEIPSDLVRPTVAALANERIQIIEQRIMTRDNLLAIAKKYQLSAGWQDRMSGTELVDFIRERTQIKAVEDRLLSSAGGPRKDAIAFTVGFEYENPQIAMRVANEFVTMILNEDVRSRTEFATQTTKFLEQEVKRLEAKLGLINKQISEFNRLHADALTDTSKLTDTQKIASYASGRNFFSRVRVIQTNIPILRRSNERSGHWRKPRPRQMQTQKQRRKPMSQRLRMTSELIHLRHKG